MTTTRSKQDLAKGGLKPSLLPDSASAATVDAAGDTLDASLLQSMMESLKNDIFRKIDASAASLHSEILSVRQELKSSVEPLQRAVEAHKVTIRDLEQAATDHNTRIDKLEATVDMLTSQVKRLDDKCEDLEGRSRRNNLRVMGIPEGLEGARTTDFVAQLLRDLLKLDEKPLLDRAHRTLRERPKEGDLTSALCCKGTLLSYPEPDLQQAVKRTLHSYPNVKFGLLFPATLKITMPNGTSHRFEDPTVATDFVNKNCK
ncbi:hypothetical protein JOQ06_001728 [Pogonophryne albipinna]|uniref:LINE-1 type transposase domain-containing 1 n=1 Tax=Pogonophryne albipinna TaxID=1090488 RepID=A0AAD6B7Q7_9TELE|nr:hypothetical protein JOQ06_001728 [Pogonophryne albipinna]